jgi:hypothetical protein
MTGTGRVLLGQTLVFGQVEHSQKVKAWILEIASTTFSRELKALNRK